MDRLLRNKKRHHSSTVRRVICTMLRIHRISILWRSWGQGRPDIHVPAPRTMRLRPFWERWRTCSVGGMPRERSNSLKRSIVSVLSALSTDAHCFPPAEHWSIGARSELRRRVRGCTRHELQRARTKVKAERGKFLFDVGDPPLYNARITR